MPVMSLCLTEAEQEVDGSSVAEIHREHAWMSLKMSEQTPECHVIAIFVLHDTLYSGPILIGTPRKDLSTYSASSIPPATDSSQLHLDLSAAPQLRCLDT